MKTLYTLAREHADLMAALAVVAVYAGLVLVWACLEDAAMRAEERHQQALEDTVKRLLVVIVQAVEAADDERGDGGASSRLAADRPADHCGGGPRHVPAGTDGHHDGDGRTGHRPDQDGTGGGARMIVE